MLIIRLNIAKMLKLRIAEIYYDSECDIDTNKAKRGDVQFYLGYQW